MVISNLESDSLLGNL